MNAAEIRELVKADADDIINYAFDEPHIAISAVEAEAIAARLDSLQASLEEAMEIMQLADDDICGQLPSAKFDDWKSKYASLLPERK